ncbi:LLM class flavin-dependent oxidoreductase [Aeromicrobium sp. P5_D10]
MAPFHARPGDNPTVGLHHDLKIAKHLDQLGYDEIWFGEHHSGGVELLGSPEIFGAWVAGQTSRIKIGTGVISLPYHNPLWVAERAILLDHLTRGRFMLGIGPGSLATDGDMLGLDVSQLRNYLQEDFPILMRLLRTDDLISIDTGRYRLVDARVQLDPYSDFDIAVTSVFTPSGPMLAGRFGIGLLQLSGLTPDSLSILPGHWETVEAQATKYDTTVQPKDWRVVSIMHVAETKDKAIEQVRYGLEHYFNYFQDVVSMERLMAAGRTFNDRLEWAMETGYAVVGTPEDAINKLEEMNEASSGRVGAFLHWATDWASPDDTLRNYSLFAERVMPQFQGTLDRIQSSQDWVSRNSAEITGRLNAGAKQFAADHSAARV